MQTYENHWKPTLNARLLVETSKISMFFNSSYQWYMGNLLSPGCHAVARAHHNLTPIANGAEDLFAQRPVCHGHGEGGCDCGRGAAKSTGTRELCFFCFSSKLVICFWMFFLDRWFLFANNIECKLKKYSRKGTVGRLTEYLNEITAGCLWRWICEAAFCWYWDSQQEGRVWK